MYLTPTEVDRAKARYNAWAADGYPGADEGLSDILDLFVPLHGICPVFSCIGHSHVEADPGDFYILFAATREATPHLLGICRMVRNSYTEKHPLHLGNHDFVSIEELVNLTPCSDGLALFDYPPAPWTEDTQVKSYFSVCLKFHWDTFNRECHFAFLRILIKTLKRVTAPKSSRIGKNVKKVSGSYHLYKA